MLTITILAAIDIILGSGASLAAIISVLVVLIGGVGTIGRTYFRNQKMAGAMAAKDEVIKTNAQTIEAFEGRISTLETKLSDIAVELERSHNTIENLTLQIVNWERKYQSLKDFVVPASIERLIALLREDNQTNDPDINDLIAELTTIKAKLETIQGLSPQP